MMLLIQSLGSSRPASFQQGEKAKMKRNVILFMLLELVITMAGALPTKGKERVMHDGPKVAIRSTGFNVVSRQKNSDLHEIYLTPYRYIEKEMKAVVTFLEASQDGSSGSVQGVVHLSQDNPAGGVKLKGNIRGLTPGKHGIHIHEFGDVRDHCRADRMGSHYNPYKFNHGPPNSRQRHAGDLGNIEVQPDGTADFVLTDKILSLVGGRSIIGRSIVIDQEPDDYTPNSDQSRRPVLCGVIGRVD